MRATESEKSSLDDDTKDLINGLFQRPKSQLVKDYVIERDAKNHAYYFIIESGLMEAFRGFVLRE